MKKKTFIFCLVAIILALVAAVPSFAQGVAPVKGAVVTMPAGAVQLPMPAEVKVEAPSIGATLKTSMLISKNLAIFEILAMAGFIYLVFAALLEFKKLVKAMQDYYGKCITLSGEIVENIRPDPGAGGRPAPAAGT